MTLDEFIQKYNGKGVDWDNYAAGQCVDLFRYYCDEVLGIPQPAGVWGAANFWSDFSSDPVLVENFTQLENTTNFIPNKGDVAIWNFNAGGGYGHVAIVCEDNNTLDNFTSFDQNWSKVSYCEIVKHNYNKIFGFLRPKTSSQTTESESEENMADNTWNEICALIGVAENSTKDTVYETIKNYKGDSEKYKKLYDEKKDEITILNNTISNLNGDIKNLNNKIDKQSQDYANSLKDMDENLKNNYISKAEVEKNYILKTDIPIENKPTTDPTTDNWFIKLLKIFKLL